MAGAARQRAARFLKVALPLAGAGIVVTIFAFPRGEFSGGVGFDGLSGSFGEGLRLANPRFSGAAADGRPFTLRADWALPDGPDPERVGLGPVSGEFRLDDARSVGVVAGGGEFRPKAETLTLEGGVTVTTSDGWRLTATRADVDVAGGALTAAGPVAGAGPGGSIEAGAMRAARRAEGDYIWFEGGVTVRIDPGARTEGRP
jgi:lipopolysaccharide export system protein LptC